MPLFELRMNKTIYSLKCLKCLLWNNSCTIISHHLYKMDLFSREELKANLYPVRISDF